MNIRKDLDEMFRITSIDHANTNTPNFGDTAKDAEQYNEIWGKIQEAYQQGAKDVMDYIFSTYEVLSKEDIEPSLEDFSEETKIAYRKLMERARILECKVNNLYCQCEEPDRDTGYTYCQRCHKHVSDARMRFLVNVDEKFDIPAKEPTLEDMKRQIMRHDFEYNTICARATLYPGKTIEEVNDILYMKRVEEAYKFVNEVLCNEKEMNDKKTRQWVIEKLQTRLEHEVVVKCDDENNPPSIIDQNLLITRLIRRTADGSAGYRYLDLVFGEKERVDNYQRQHYLDNETFKFIEKGI